MPRLHRAKTVACGLLKWGKCVWIMGVHSVTRGWQDIRILLGGMGRRQTPLPLPPEGCIVTSCMLLYRHFSKTYCRKRRGRRGTWPVDGTQARFDLGPDLEPGGYQRGGTRWGRHRVSSSLRVSCTV